MFKIDNISKNINNVKIGNIDVKNLGLYLKEDFELTYSIVKEMEEKYIKGRDMPYHKFIRTKPIEFEIEFELKDGKNFYARIEHLKKVLELSKEQLITFNGEQEGLNIYYAEARNVTRSKAIHKVTIYFMCYPK